MARISDKRDDRVARQVLALSGLLLVYALGWAIPLAAELTYIAPNRPRVVIFDLGLEPFILPLVLLEFAKLLFPRLLRWQFTSARNATRLSDYVRVGALILAGIQGYYYTSIFQYAGPEDGRSGVLLAGAATFVGSTALVSWLADRISINCQGNGFWLLWLTPAILGASRGTREIFELVTTGVMPLSTLLMITGFTLASCAALIIAYLVLIDGPTPIPSAADSDRMLAARLASMAFIWPPLLTNLALRLILSALAPSRTHNSELYAWIGPGSPGFFLLTAGLIMLFSWTYARRSLVDRRDIVNVFAETPETARSTLPFWFLGLLQVAICVGQPLLARAVPHWHSLFAGPSLIILVTVAMSFVRAWGFPPFRPRPSGRR